jgi:hypothetical protein
LFLDTDAHKAHLEHFLEEIGAELCLFVHGADVGGEPLSGKLPDSRLEETFFFLQDCQGRSENEVSDWRHDGTMIAPEGSAKNDATSSQHRYIIYGRLMMMRTTVDLDEDLLRLAKHLAREREESLGRVLSDLVRRGLQPEPARHQRGSRIPVLARKPGARPVTTSAVQELLENEI